MTPVERGEIYLGVAPEPDPRRRRVYVIVSRPELVQSRYSSVVCVPVYSTRSGLPTEVNVGPEHGLKVESALRCDELTSVQRAELVSFVGSLPPPKMIEVNRAMAIAFAISAADL
jgi:mRNA interferase MazF